MHFFDIKGICGTIVTFLFAFVGVITLERWATIFAILAGASTLLYNFVRIRNEVKNNRKNKPNKN